MSRRVFCLLLACVFSFNSFAKAAEDRPNVVWILSEDNSKHYLRLYGAELGVTPTIEGLAKDGLTFEHAFSNSPVCSVARTTLMSGMYAPRIGFQYHRKLKLANLPPGAKLFPAYLRDAGYYTSNNSKKDYNVVEGKVWDESSRKASWRKRPKKDMPFFHMMSTGVSHESSLHFTEKQMAAEELITNPQDVELQPYFPDTPTFRHTLARYFDRMRLVDEQVARVVKQLKEDGVYDNTIIFYFGDHGGVLPRSKGYIYESGLHVPLVVRVPEKWQDLSPFKRGSRVDGFVSFIDFSSTVLNLAGVDVPKTMDGRPFLGGGVTASEVNSRDEAYGYADRFDEKYEAVRSLRKGRYKYMRNFEGFYPDGQQNNYRYRQLAFAEWRHLYRAGKLNKTQSQFFEPKRPELLFDVEADPHEVTDLASDPKYRDVLEDMRKRLEEKMLSLPDLSLFPESHVVANATDDGAAYGQKHKNEMAVLLRVANLALQPFEVAKADLEAALKMDSAVARNWALVACSSFGPEAESLAPTAKTLLKDKDLLDRVRAAEFLTIVSEFDPSKVVVEALEQTDSPVAALIIANSICYLRDEHGIKFDIDPKKLKVGPKPIERRLEYFSTGKG